MIKTRTIPFFVLLLIAIAHSGVAANGGQLSVTVAQQTITASGLTPGSTAVFFGVAQVPIPHGYMNRIQQWAVTIADTGNAGTVTLDLHQDVPPISVWAVVDLGTSRYGTVSGSGVGLREITLANPLRKGPSQTVDHFAFDHGYLELLYVQPGLGAWTWSAVGGTGATPQESAGSTEVTLTAGTPAGQSSQTPAAFLPGGILVAVDFTRLEIAVVPIDQQLIGGAP